MPGRAAHCRIFDAGSGAVVEGVVRHKGLHDEQTGVPFAIIETSHKEAHYVRVTPADAAQLVVGERVRIAAIPGKWLTAPDQAIARAAAANRGIYSNLWSTDYFNSKIWRITTAGVFTDFSTPTKNRPTRITDGPDGNVWFIEPDLHLVARITPAGTITEFPLLTGLGPQDVVGGPDGNLWIVEGNQIDRMTPAGVVTPLPMPSIDFEPSYITVGPDGNLWFTDYNRGMIGRIIP